MPDMNAELYNAMIAAGVPPAEAQAAATSFSEKVQSIKTEVIMRRSKALAHLTIIQWLLAALGTAIIINVVSLWFDIGLGNLVSQSAVNSG